MSGPSLGSEEVNVVRKITNRVHSGPCCALGALWRTGNCHRDRRVARSGDFVEYSTTQAKVLDVMWFLVRSSTVSEHTQPLTEQRKVLTVKRG